MKGGYKIIDFKNVSLSGTPVTMTDVLVDLLNNYEKVVLLSHVVLSGSAKDDCFSTVLSDGEGGAKLNCYDGYIAITSEGSVTYTVASPSGMAEDISALKNYTRRTQRNITNDLAYLPRAVAEQNLEKYGYSIGDYFAGASGYTYFLADMNTFRGAQNSYAVINQNHIAIVVKTGTNSKWNDANDTSTGYAGSVLHSYLSGTVLNNIKSDMIALFGGSTGLEHLLSHKLLWTTAVSSWAWSEAEQYISALTEPQVYGITIWSIDGYQTGEAWRHLELFKKFSYMEILGWIWFWLRSIRSASYACAADYAGRVDTGVASTGGGVVGLIVFK